MVDHLFRQHYGKMVSILTRFFGLQHLETIEDAIQDTFINAMKAWQISAPDNPEAWLVRAAKNRTLDLFRKLSAEDARIAKIEAGTETIAIHELFLESEIEDAVLRMVFTACNPVLNPKDQIAFALKTISGFSRKEIASALLLKEETVKKRLTRARGVIAQGNISFEIPQGEALPPRLERVLEVIYLIFNEGFHSNRREELIREDLCGEAIRLAKALQGNKYTNGPASQALLALFCFQAARLPGKTGPQKELISLRDQDRSTWRPELVWYGNEVMEEAVDTPHFTRYHYEAAIAAEHTQAPSYESTNWERILIWYERLHALEDSPFDVLNIAVVQLQLEHFDRAQEALQAIAPEALEQRAYLYYGTAAECAYQQGKPNEALVQVDKAIAMVENQAERDYLLQKRELYRLA